MLHTVFIDFSLITLVPVAVAISAMKELGDPLEIQAGLSRQIDSVKLAWFDGDAGVINDQIASAIPQFLQHRIEMIGHNWFHAHPRTRDRSSDEKRAGFNPIWNNGVVAAASQPLDTLDRDYGMSSTGDAGTHLVEQVGEVLD